MYMFADPFLKIQEDKMTQCDNCNGTFPKQIFQELGEK